MSAGHLHPAAGGGLLGAGGETGADEKKVFSQTVKQLVPNLSTMDVLC